MKTIKKLLCTLVALTLVFCTFSSMMVVRAIDWEKNGTYCEQAFSSVTIGGKKVDLENLSSGGGELYLKTKKKKVKIKVKLKNGWKYKTTYYYDSKDRTIKVKNGGKLKTKEILDCNVMVVAKKGGKTAELTIGIDSGRY